MPQRKQKAGLTKNQVRTIAKKVVLGTAETKQRYTEIDEQTITPGTTGLTLNRFMEVPRMDIGNMPIPRDNQNPVREGAQILPTSFQFRGWFRPRALQNDGLADDPKSELFDRALYVRVIFIKTSTLHPNSRMPDNSLTVANDNFFLGPNGLPQGQALNYSDIYKPLNWKITGKPLMDKVMFIPNQYGMKNTKQVLFNHKFSKNEKLYFEQNVSGIGQGNSAIPDKHITAHIIARYCDDDTHIQYENLELSGTGIFKFKDF